MTQSSLVSDLKDLFEVKTGKYVTVQQLKEWLPTVEVALWFAKVYAFDAVKVGELLSRLFHTDIVTALTKGEHSVDLQDYLVAIVPDDIKELAAPVWTHRLVLAPEAEFAGVTAEGVLAKALSTTQPPMATGSR